MNIFVYLILLAVCIPFTMGFILRNVVLVPSFVSPITVLLSDLLHVQQIIRKLCFEGVRDIHNISTRYPVEE